MLHTSIHFFSLKKSLKNKLSKAFWFVLFAGFFSIQIAEAQNTVSAASSTPTVCINTALTWITHTTTGATGIANAGTAGANGLPTGVAATLNNDTITIYGTPSDSGVFNYSIPLTGGSGSVNATGTITVAPSTVASTFTGTTTVCAGLPAQFTSSATSACSSLTQSLNIAGAGTASASLVITATDNFTIEGWIKPNTANGTTSIFYNNGFGLIISGTSLRGIVPGVAFLSSSANVTVGAWQHVALVRNSGIWTIYLNGTAYPTNPTNTSPNNQNKGTFIGCNLNNGEKFNGKISQVAFWNTVRTTAQIQADMQACSFSGDGLAAYWSLNGTANDLSGNGKHLTLSSTTYSTDAPIIQTGAQYVFNFGDGTSQTSNVGSATRTYTAANTYTVSLTVTNACTTSTSTQSITVNNNPTASISGPTAACGSATLTASGGTSYVWTSGSSLNTDTTTISTTSTPTVTVSNTFGCSATASQSVTITPNTVAGTISANQTITSPSGSGTSSIIIDQSLNGGGWMQVRPSTSGPMPWDNSPEMNAAQSFRASLSALWTSLKIYVQNVNQSGDFTLQVFNGDGVNGTSLLSQTVTISSTGMNTFTFSSPISITTGQYYTFKLSSNGSAYVYIDYSGTTSPLGTLYENGNSMNGALYFENSYQINNANWDNLTLTGKTGTILYWQQSADSIFSNPTTIANTITTLYSGIIGNLSNTTYFRAVVQSGSCNILNTNNVTITVNITTTWNGSSWSNGAPTSTSDAVIASNTAPASFTCKNLTINSTFALNTTGITATVHGNIINNGNGIAGTGGITISANSILSGNVINFSGTLTINGSTAQTLNANAASVQNVTINNAAGVTLTGAINLTGVLTPTAGVLTTGGFLTLKSSALGTASIGTAIGSISGNVTVERFIPRRRAFRFLASPVNTSNFIAGNWQQATHITGSTTGQNGFDQSVSGTASLFTYNTSSEAWAAIPNTSATNLTIGTGYRMLVRGDRTINLNTTAQDSAALVLSATGSIVTGNVVFGGGSVSSSPAGIPALNAAIGSGANNSTIGWSLIGNPYACAVDWSNVTKSNVSSTFATWNVNNAGRGSYVYHNGSAGSGFGASNIINSGQSIFVQTTAANPSITFTEASKVTATPPSHFKKGLSNVLNIDIFIGDRAYDALTVLFNAENNNDYDANDFVKLVNPEINFYSYLADGTRLAMNNMKEIGTETIVPLGLNGVFNGGSYELKFSNQNTFAHAEVKLKDKFIDKMYDLKLINNLTFTVTSDSNSFGENRFELIFSKSATGINSSLSASNNHFMVFPNPTNNVLNLSLTTTQEDNYSYTIFNQLGAEISKGQLNFNSKRTHALNIENLSNGVYFIQVKNGQSSQTIKFIK